MADLPPFLDVETALVELFSDLATTGTVTPPSLLTSLPFVRVTRIGGLDTRLFDTARVDVDSFGATRAVSYDLAEACRQRLLSYPQVTAAGVIDLVVTNAGPHEVPWGDTNVRRFTASYSISARR